MKKDIKLKGQLKLYMQWPGIMILFLILMNIWIFRMDRKAGLLMSAFVLVYAVVIGIMYFYNKSLILADMVEFAAQYGIVQNTLLKELSIPYAILLDDGKIIWTNTQFREVLGTTIRKDTYLSKYIPELNRGVFPKEENESVSLEFNYFDRDYQAEIQCVSVEGFSETEQLLEIPEEKEYFIAIHLQDVTELNRYIRANEEQRLVAGLVYIDNYEEVMESVEEVRQSLLVALIDRKINQYIADFSGIVKKLEKDKYFVVIKKESFNHYTYGTVDDWIFRTIGGVDQEDTGYRRLMIHPQPDKSLTWAKRSFETENGTVSVSWKREGGQFLLTADIPCNTTARIILPDGTQHTVGSGHYTLNC